MWRVFCSSMTILSSRSGNISSPSLNLNKKRLHLVLWKQTRFCGVTIEMHPIQTRTSRQRMNRILNICLGSDNSLTVPMSCSSEDWEFRSATTFLHHEIMFFFSQQCCTKFKLSGTLRNEKAKKSWLFPWLHKEKCFVWNEKAKGGGGSCARRPIVTNCVSLQSGRVTLFQENTWLTIKAQTICWKYVSRNIPPWLFWPRDHFSTTVHNSTTFEHAPFRCNLPNDVYTRAVVSAPCALERHFPLFYNLVI